MNQDNDLYLSTIETDYNNDLTTIEKDNKFIKRPNPTKKDVDSEATGMPSKKLSKSISDFNSEIANYELKANIVLEKLRAILRAGFSNKLLDDYEFIVSALTLLKLNIIPRNSYKINLLYNDYECYTLN